MLLLSSKRHTGVAMEEMSLCQLRICSKVTPSVLNDSVFSRTRHNHEISLPADAVTQAKLSKKLVTLAYKQNLLMTSNSSGFMCGK